MAAEEESKKISYPLDPDSYKLVQEIGGGVSAVVYKANCLPMNPAVVAIKDINLERSNANLDDVCREAKAMALLSHPNILSAHCSFTVDRHLWVVMPFMAAGSLLSISKSYPEGLSEQLIAVVLKEALQALGYLHDQGHFHRDIKASNILVDSDGSVKLADFRVPASIYEPSSSLSGDSFLKDVAGTLYWMAPEVIPCGYGIKADIWSFGVTALELAHGRPPLTHLPLSKSLLMRITNRFKFSSYYGNKSEKKFFSKNFKDMVVTCLTQDPSKRPSAEEVLEHPFFKNCSKSPDYLVKNVLQSFPIPVAEERNPVEEEGFDGSPSPSLPSSPLEHQRICGWKFNEEILEFDPVFLTDECVQFGGESINTGKNEEKSDTTTMTHTDSSPPISVTCLDEVSRNTAEEEDTIKKCEEVTREEKSSATHGNLNIVSHLLNLLNSLDYQIEQLIKLLKSCGVEVGPRNQEQQLLQTINDLNLQLLQEKRKVSDLEEELDALKRSMRTAPR